MNDSPGPYQRRQSGPGHRFPGFDVLSQAGHWDQATVGLVASRLDPPAPLAFFTGAEAPCATALVNLLTGQQDDLQIPVLPMIDARLAAGETDGWRYADMPEDGQAWRDSLAYLDKDASLRCGCGFADASEVDQMALLQAEIGRAHV